MSNVVEANAAGREHINKLTARITELETANKGLQLRNAMLVDALITLRDDSKGVGGWSSLTGLKVEQALSATSAQSTAWLEENHREWMKGLPVRTCVGQLNEFTCFELISNQGCQMSTLLYALPVKEIKHG